MSSVSCFSRENYYFSLERTFLMRPPSTVILVAIIFSLVSPSSTRFLPVHVLRISSTGRRLPRRCDRVWHMLHFAAVAVASGLQAHV